MSPIEVILNDIHNGINGDGLPNGQLVETWYILDQMFSPQVLNAMMMAVTKMRTIIAELAQRYNVQFFYFRL